jgi:hypothetical protein
MITFGLISIPIQDNSKHGIGQFNQDKYLYKYSGSVINNGSKSCDIRLFMLTPNGVTETAITIPSGVSVRFIDLIFESIQAVSGSPDLYLIAAQSLTKSKAEMNGENSQIFYE